MLGANVVGPFTETPNRAAAVCASGGAGCCAGAAGGGAAGGGASVHPSAPFMESQDPELVGEVTAPLWTVPSAPTVPVKRISLAELSCRKVMSILRPWMPPLTFPVYLVTL